MANDNIIELNDARSRIKSRAPNDKRMHPRVASDDRLFSQVVLSAEEPELVGTTLPCTAVNLSVGGIQFRTSAAVPTVKPATEIRVITEMKVRPR